MPCTRSTACAISQIEGRLSVPGDGCRSAIIRSKITHAMDHSPHRLLWRDEPIATVTDIGFYDFPSVCGKVVASHMSTQIRELLEWLDRESKTEDGVTDDPPFPAEMLDEWYIEKPDGTKTEIMIPLFDFARGTVEWR